MDTQYCQDCGQELRSEAGFCDRCGAQQGRSEAPARQPQRQQPQSGGRSAIQKILMVIGGIVVLLILAMVISSFILGLGGDTVDEDRGESVVEGYFQAVVVGDAGAAATYVHSDGPAAEQLQQEVGAISISGTNTEITATDATVVTEEEDRAVMDVELEVNEFGAETETSTVRVELRPDDGTWKIWEFPTA